MLCMSSRKWSVFPVDRELSVFVLVLFPDISGINLHVAYLLLGKFMLIIRQFFM